MTDPLTMPLRDHLARAQSPFGMAIDLVGTHEVWTVTRDREPLYICMNRRAAFQVYNALVRAG